MKAIFSFVWISLTLSGAFAQSLKTDYSFRKYLLENVHYPEAAIQQGVSDKAYAFFEVGTNGKVINVKTACGHQGMGFEQAIEQTLLAAPMQAKSAFGKYQVDFEFTLLLPNGQRQSNEVVVGNPLVVPEGTVKLNTVKIETTASAKTVKSSLFSKNNSIEINSHDELSRFTDLILNQAEILLDKLYPQFKEKQKRISFIEGELDKSSITQEGIVVWDINIYNKDDKGYQGNGYFTEDFGLFLVTRKKGSDEWKLNPKILILKNEKGQKQFPGFSDKIKIINSILYIEQLELSDSDPKCCPSIKNQYSYLFNNNEFILKSHSRITQPWEGNISNSNDTPYPPSANRKIVPNRSRGSLSYLKEYDGQYPSQAGLFENEELPLRMKKLMGEASFAKFVGYAQEEKPIQFHNGLALITGCKQNDCERYESVVFINTGLDKIYIGLLDNNQVQTWSDHPAFKSYDPTSIPTEFKTWFLDASRKSREWKGNGSVKTGENEKVSSTRNTNLLGANSPEELAKILLQALKNNDKKTWMRHLHPDHIEGEKRFDQHRECLSQQGISNWSSVIFSRMTYSLRGGGAYGKADPSITIPSVVIDFTYQNKEFFGRILLAEFVKYEGKWFALLYNHADSCEVTRYPRN